MRPEEHRPQAADFFQTRREFLCKCGMGMGTIGLAGLLHDSGLLGGSAYAGEGAPSASPLSVKLPHFPAKAKRVIHMMAQGGPSHVDTLDPKPALEKYDGKPIKEVVKDTKLGGVIYKSIAQFKKYGQSGTEVSDLFPHLASVIDNVAVIRSMTSTQASHPAGLQYITTGGERMISRPAMGSWVTYGMGSENQNLPGYIVLCPGGRGAALQGDPIWQSSFLPSVFQGTFINTGDTRIEKLIEFIKSPTTSLTEQRRQLDLLRELDSEFHEKRQREAGVEGRIQSYESAFRMQSEASDAFDIEKEPKHVRDMYGDSHFGKQTLMARRLVERGVRFVQMFHGGWDHHSDIETTLRDTAKQTDHPVGGLIKDLKQRGMLEDTLVIWGGEMGRTPTAEMRADYKAKGRDHHISGFSMWMAGGGIKGGQVYGATDEFGINATQNKMTVPDLHATILHLLGFDHTKLTYRYAGRDFRLTDVHGDVQMGLLK